MKEKEIEMLTTRMDLFWKRLGGMILGETQAMSAKFARTDDMLKFPEQKKLKYKEIKEGQKWGAEWGCAWFELNASVPKPWAGKEIVAQIELTGEGLVFDSEGVPFQSITNGSVFQADYNKDICYLFKKCKGGEKISLWVEAVGNALFGVNRKPDADPADPKRHGTFSAVANKMRICVFNREVYDLWLDMDVICGIARLSAPGSVRKARAIKAANDAIDAFAENPANAIKARAILKTELQRKATDLDLSTSAVGHAHIDTGWLWRVREGIRKCGRTFASQITLMEKYPGYIFGASQAQHYEFTKTHYPALYEKIKRMVKAGRWELQGAMWVEADCNITSGESLVRQIVHGKNFFMDEFGVDVRNLWLPDVFGYSAALPQILRKSGVDFFVTQKLCWSQFNKFPHTTFVWEGIDGSEVLSHFPPENTYNSPLKPEGLAFARENFRENAVLDEFLTLFGIGDGGGGPKEEFIERGIRLADVQGVPKVKFERAQDFLDRLVLHRDELPRWVGELYLEVHRGTYTTQARVKKGNRKLEQKLRMAEFICSCMPIAKYPIARLDRIWKTLLVNQFHDILPGSSIHGVYQDTWRQHDECIADCEHIVSDAARSIFKDDKNSVVLANCLSTEFNGVVELPDEVRCGLEDENGRQVPVQIEDGTAVAKIAVPGNSFVTLKKTGPARKAKTPDGAAGLRLENALICYEFAEDGTLRRIFDKECGRELLDKGGKGNLFTLYTDIPNNWDAWDIDFHYERSALSNAKAVKAEALPSGEVRSGLNFALEIGNSTIEQKIFLASGSRRLDFRTKVDWREKHKMLRVSFPVAIRSEEASFEIQYGYLRRPTHRNTGWDFAKFEVVAHRYADISEQDYGVAILNDCKYGHKIQGNVMDLNLLRSPTEPDPDADAGVHEFTYSLLPHKGSFVESNVISEAASLNMGVAFFDRRSGRGVKAPCWISSGDGSISIEAMKRAEKENCHVIRLVETKGRNSSATLQFADPSAKIVECDIMEWKNTGSPRPCAKGVEIKMRPFEIRTYKIV